MSHIVEAQIESVMVAALAKRCSEHTAEFRIKRAAPPVGQDPCFELFRLALQDESQAAWHAITQQYQAQVSDWLRAHPNIGACQEEPDYFVNGTFVRLWRHAAPHIRAGRLVGIGPCLRYLKLCAWTEIQNHLRKQRTPHVPLLDESDYGDDMSSEQRNVAEAVSRITLARHSDEIASQELRLVLDQLARLLEQTLQDDRERLVAEEAWGMGLPTRDIFARHTDLFANATEVHQVARNIVRRLQRHPNIKKLLGE